MLKLMRHHAKYFYVLFFIVILSFIFWGVGTVDDDPSARVLAEVGRHKITVEEYGRAYDRATRFYRDIYRERWDEMKETLNLKETTLDALIENRLLLITAERIGIRVSEEELKDAIITDPSFMKNGVFDRQVYENALRLSRTTSEVYEAAKRQDLKVRKTVRFIEMSAPGVSEQLPVVGGDEQSLRAVKEAMINDARDKAVKAYLEGMKKGMNIKVNRDLMS